MRTPSASVPVRSAEIHSSEWGGAVQKRVNDQRSWYASLQLAEVYMGVSGIQFNPPRHRARPGGLTAFAPADQLTISAENVAS